MTDVVETTPAPLEAAPKKKNHGVWIFAALIILSVAAAAMQAYWQHQTPASSVNAETVEVKADTVVVETPAVKPSPDFTDTGASWTDKVKASVKTSLKPKPKAKPPVVAEKAVPGPVAEEVIPITVSPYKYESTPGIFSTTAGRPSLTKRQQDIADRRANLLKPKDPK